MRAREGRRIEEEIKGWEEREKEETEWKGRKRRQRSIERTENPGGEYRNQRSRAENMGR